MKAQKSLRLRSLERGRPDAAYRRRTLSIYIQKCVVCASCLLQTVSGRISRRRHTRAKTEAPSKRCAPLRILQLRKNMRKSAFRPGRAGFRRRIRCAFPCQHAGTKYPLPCPCKARILPLFVLRHKVHDNSGANHYRANHYPKDRIHAPTSL